MSSNPFNAKERLQEINGRIAHAAKLSGRDLSDITLVAVSKTKTVAMIEQFINVGVKLFGENKVQEGNPKIATIRAYDPSIDFHFIGRLQSNKADEVVGRYSLIHSVDRESLIDSLIKACIKDNIKQDLLLQVNIANEPQKGGASLKDIQKLIELIENNSYLNLRGLMMIPPLENNPEENRKYFAQMKSLFDDLKGSVCKKDVFDTLSMGMSDDFEIAISEGANLVRVGTALFGER